MCHMPLHQILIKIYNCFTVKLTSIYKQKFYMLEFYILRKTDTEISVANDILDRFISK